MLNPKPYSKHRVLAALMVLLRSSGEIGHGQGPLHVVRVDLRLGSIDAFDRV